MSINSTTRTAGPYTGTGLVSIYPFAFKVFQTSDVLVVRTDTSGAQSTLALSSDYSVTLNADQDTNPGGIVTLVVPLPASYTLELTSNIPVTQPATLTNLGGFFPKVIEAALDRLTILFQQLGLVGIVQTLRVPEIGGVPALPAKALRKSKVLATDANGDFQLIVGVDSGSAAALNLDLLDKTSGAKGAGIPGMNPALTYTTQSAGAALQRTALPLSQFTGANPAGTGDSIAVLTAAATANAAFKAPTRYDGTYRIDTQFVPPRFFVGYGAGKTSSQLLADRAPSVILKNFNGTGVYLGWDDSALDSVQIDNVAGKTGDNIQLAGSRTSLRWVTSTNSGGVGVRVGTDSALGLDGFNANTNVWSLIGVQVLSSTSHAVLLNDPTGSGDANAGVILGGDFRNAGGDGIKIDNSLYNTILAPTIQNCAGPTARLTANSRGTTWIGGDLEPGAGGVGLVESGTFGNYIAGAFYGGVPVMWTNLSRGAFKGRNWIVQHDANLAKMKLHDELNIHDPDAGGTPAVNLWGEGVGSELNVARIEGSKAGVSGGKAKVQTKAVGGSLIDAVTWDETQATVLGGVVAQQATITTLASAATIAPSKPIHFVSGTTTISTITPPASFTANGGGQITLIPTGLWATNAAGNIAIATTAVVSKALILTYDKTTAKWYPSY